MSPSGAETATAKNSAPAGPSRRLLAGTFALLIVVWGTTWGAITFSLEGFAPLLGLGLRFVLGAIALCVAIAWAGVWTKPDAKLWGLWACQGAFAFGAAYGLVYWAEQWVPSGLVAVLFSTFPLWVMIFGYFVLPGERLGAAGLFGLLFAFGGIAVIFTDDLGALRAPEVAFPAFVVLLSPVAAGINQVIMKRWGGEYHALMITGPPMGLASLAILAASWALESGRPIVPTWPAVLSVVYLGLLGSALTFGLYYWLLQQVDSIRVSLITYGTPVVAVILGALFLDEPVTPRMITGAVLVLAGVAVVLRR